MRKTTISALLLSIILLTPSYANEAINFNGRVNLSAQVSDDGTGSTSEINSNASGRMATDYKLELFYRYEVQINIDDGDTFRARNQYVGLRGDFGMVAFGIWHLAFGIWHLAFGKNDTILKQSQDAIDQLNNINGDLKTLWKRVGETRAGESITYKTPVINDIQFGVTYIDGGEQVGVEGFDTVRASFSTKFSDVKYGVILQTNEEVATGLEMDGYLINAACDINDFTLKGQIQTADFDEGDNQTGFSVGADYQLEKNFKLYSFYSTFDMDSSEDREYVSIGLELRL